MLGAPSSTRAGMADVRSDMQPVVCYSTDYSEIESFGNGMLCVGECASPASQYAIVAFLWSEQFDNNLDGFDEDRENICYQRLRAHIVDALTLGISLESCKAKRILMISPNVRHVYGAELLSLYWEIRDTDPVMAHESWFGRCERRFRGTFTKLRALELVEFRKIMIMDLDMIVTKVRDLDSLFGYETPAACFRGNRENRVGEEMTRKSVDFAGAETMETSMGLHSGS